MKASELRIGNLLKHPELEISRVCVIQDNCYGVCNKKIDNSRISYLKCEPIPLTEGWLIRLGFEKDAQVNLYKLKNDFGEIVYYPKDSVDKAKFIFYLRSASFLINTIETVHQLQNLYFALTNTELVCASK